MRRLTLTFLTSKCLNLHVHFQLTSTLRVNLSLGISLASGNAMRTAARAG
jgi:hypothetical protein